MDELTRDFLLESYENLDRLDQEFVKLESDPENPDLLKSIFRTIHTIKGTCGFLGFTKLEELTHAGESLLSLLRDGELRLTEASADALLEMVDAVRGYLREIDSTGQEGNADATDLITRLKKLQERKGSEPKKCTQNESLTAMAAPGETVMPETPQRSDASQASEIPAELNDKATHHSCENAQPSKHEESRETKESAIRVDVNLLEKQMNLVSELVLLRNRLLQIAAEGNERNLNAAVHGLNYVTSELRKNVMKTRMQPVSQLFEKLPRIVRDVSKEMGKKIRLETEGGNTELDKSLLEAIKDPVTHILRNSIDHGIETPEKRLEQGKPEEGTVRVCAFHEGGNFHLEIEDDGAGIDPRKVRDKAVSKGLITESHGEKLTEAEMVNLIFLPGLSTAEKVTNVSGRGVGMDVVKTNIERIGGRAKIDSEIGRGTTTRLEIPLTLATIPALTVVSGKSVFAIPQAALVEMIGLDADNAGKCIECIDGTLMFRFRGTVLPLVDLRQELHLKDEPRRTINTVQLAVVRTEGQQIALQVDSVRSTEEIVIKPLDKRFKGIALYSGAAVLGDGRVALILDIAALARRVGMAGNQESRNDQGEAGQRKQKLNVLLLEGADGERMAVPLDWVQRLEEFDVAAKERLADEYVMQYRNEILPVVELADLLDERRRTKRTAGGLNSPRGSERIAAVLVKGENGKNVILQVHRILGIVKLEFEKLHAPSRAGVCGTLVVQERVTELLELKELLARMPHEMTAGELIAAGAESRHDS